ncbi:sulfite reductase [Photobacterium kishitanii]|uniref:Anaerobic sulfite reductase subunit AsrB n=2 Tax=Photobacterium kishitanii TaxID=318456 RepID=A0AAX0YNR9_9GAMM|nr:anaerobic sulfite reductase subunit AsrB [Photobacterium kishitanii]KJG55281.1 sulfite reductase [Photobacterium kishitanii]KJG57665.1 sulfite reductase [Photobacterium kishitanii]KJG63618.1 sulfite reductase [Photobacterium kishitanii]KJG66200.1 sulfite reductase [Photobacterium kishitanii]PSX16819.1 anaerobic sulfite reductase subunit AsrB [Photobacterium kishitanii]
MPKHHHDCHSHDNILMPNAYPILDIIKYTDNEWNFRVAKNFETKLGQFVEVSLPMVGEAPISVSDCGDNYIDLLIRNVGKVTQQLFQLKIGDNIWMRGVHGNGYPIESYHDNHLIIIAGGTGVAPVKGLIRHFVEAPEKIKGMDMILGFKNQDAVLYRDEMPQWRQCQHLITTLDQGEANDEFEVGVVTEHIDKLDLSDLANTQAIVVGPPIMIKFAVQALLQQGLTKQQIWVDYERRMACAVGKCGHCRMGEKYVCIDGPVFRFDEAEYLID